MSQYEGHYVTGALFREFKMDMMGTATHLVEFKVGVVLAQNRYGIVTLNSDKGRL